MAGNSKVGFLRLGRTGKKSAGSRLPIAQVSQNEPYRGDIVHLNLPRIGWRDHSIQTLLHLVQITVAYVLMLAFMTYNGWLCIALLLGSAFGYLVFAKSREEFADQSDCH